MLWCKVEAGACLVDPNNPPKWYIDDRFMKKLNINRYTETFNNNKLNSNFNRVVEGNGTAQGEVAEPWRIHILNELKSRMKELDFDLSLCEKAIEKLVLIINLIRLFILDLKLNNWIYIDRSSWVKNGEAKCKLKGSSTYEDCIVELEWISSDSGSLDSGTLTILNPDGATTLVSF